MAESNLHALDINLIVSIFEEEVEDLPVQVLLALLQSSVLKG